jgi:hypothetical protein
VKNKQKIMGSLGISIALAAMAFAAPATAATGYYEFSSFAGTGSEYDVDSYGNTIYYGYGSAVYAVDVSIADMSKRNEPRFLSDGFTPNPNYQTRIFSNNRYIGLTGAPGPINYGSIGEMWVDANYIYTIGGGSSTSNGKSIYAFDKTTGAYASAVSPLPYASGLTGAGWGYSTLLSYGDGKWWMAGEYRSVYSSADGSNWNYEFSWNPTSGGSHGDGMEYVNGYIFVSDMTSNYIMQWQKSGGAWSEINSFAYTEAGGASKAVEGMGFGALDHFWAGSGGAIYELGGGSIQQYVDRVPEPGTLLLLSGGLAGLAGLRRRMPCKIA